MTDQIKLCLNDMVRDNDPRMSSRPAFRVWAISNSVAFLAHPSDARGDLHIGLHRIFTDNKPRKSGWSVVR